MSEPPRALWACATMLVWLLGAAAFCRPWSAHASSFEPSLLLGQEALSGSDSPAASPARSGNVLGFNLPVLESPDGLDPVISFEYSPSGLDGEVGVGWQFTGLSSIRARGVLGGTPNGASGTTYEVDGKRLIPGSDGALYPRHADGWRFQDLPGLSWLGVRDGDQLFFGDGNSSGCAGNGVVANQLTPTLCLPDQYLLTERRDAFGNAIRYVYTEPNQPELVSEIHYNLQDSSNYFLVRFLYESRPDPRTVCEVGRCRRMDRRLDEVRIFNIAGGTEHLTHGYDLQYQVSIGDGRSLLWRLVQRGVTNAGAFSGNNRVLREMTYADPSNSTAVTDMWESVAALTFVDEQGAPMDPTPAAIRTELDVQSSLDDAYTATLLVDIDADALPDVVVLNEDDGIADHHVFLNEVDAHGEPTFRRSVEQSLRLTNADVSDLAETSFIDLNRDGAPELVRYAATGWNVLVGQPGGLGEASVDGLQQAWVGSTPHKFADVNGDGAPDIIEQDRWFENTGGRNGVEFFDLSAPLLLTPPLPVLDETSFGGIDCMQPNTTTLAVYEGDVGDVRNPTGHSNVPPFVPNSGTPEFTALALDGPQWVWRHTSHADVNGDGLADRIINLAYPRLDGSFWVDDSAQCGTVERVYLGDGLGGFHPAPGGLGGESSWATQADTNLLTMQSDTYDVVYDIPFVHFGFADIDGNGRPEVLNRCGEVAFSSSLRAVRYRNADDGFTCADILAEEAASTACNPTPRRSRSTRATSVTSETPPGTATCRPSFRTAVLPSSPPLRWMDRSGCGATHHMQT